MQNQTIQWQPYLGAFRGSRTLEGRFVTVTAAGAMSISTELSAKLPPGKKWMRIEYAEAIRKLRLTPIQTGEAGSLRMQLPGEHKTSKGRQVRIGTGPGMKAWGLVPKAGTRYEAQWEGESLIVDLGSPIGGTIAALSSSLSVSSVPSVPSVAQTSSPINDDLIDILMVTQLAKCSEPTLYAWMKGKGFPRPIERRGKKCFWSRTAVAQWLVSRGGPQRPRAGKPAAAKPAPTCANCGDGKAVGKRTICRSLSDHNPNRNHSVDPTCTCDWHRKPGVYVPARTEED